MSWSIVVRLTLHDRLDPGTVQERWEELGRQFTGVGRVGRVQVSRADDAADLLPGFADDAYGDRDPLLRVGVGASGRVLLVAAHHGAMDGLGLVGAAGRLGGLSLDSNARGVASDADATNFWIASVRRLVEALVRPPQRLWAARARRGAGDVLSSRTLGSVAGGSSGLLLAVTRGIRAWNSAAPRRARRGRLIVAMGLSRRPGTPMAPPDRDTAYVRLDAHHLRDLTDARETLEQTRPEPAFPQTEGLGIGPLVTRVLSNRLGSTVLASNLGLIEAPGLAALEFWPVPTGPAGVAVGLASSSTRSVLTVRGRRPWFDQDAIDRLATVVAQEWVGPQ